MAIEGIKAQTNRIRLEDKIPLDTPLRVFIDTSSVCNFHCQFCPHGDGEAAKLLPQAVMPVELAKKCVDDLTEFPQKIKRLSFSTLGEPLVNRNLPEIVSYAAQKNVAECMEITTNASLLTPEMSRQLIDAGLNDFEVSIYGLNSETYRDFSGCSFSFERLVDNLTYLYSIKGAATIAIKITDAVCNSEEDIDQFHQIFSPICDKICLEHVIQIWHDFDAKAENDALTIYGTPITRKTVCPVPFYTMAVRADGKVCVCCSDWKNRLLMGDVHTQSLLSIWKGPGFRDLCIRLLKEGVSGIIPCDRCHFHETIAMDNIDSYRAELLQKL